VPVELRDVGIARREGDLGDGLGGLAFVLEGAETGFDSKRDQLLAEGAAVLGVKAVEVAT